MSERELRVGRVTDSMIFSQSGTKPGLHLLDLDRRRERERLATSNLEEYVSQEAPLSSPADGITGSQPHAAATNKGSHKCQSTRQDAHDPLIGGMHAKHYTHIHLLTRSGWTSGRGNLGSPSPDRPRGRTRRTPPNPPASSPLRCWRCDLLPSVA